jgi:hypothetical protein
VFYGEISIEAHGPVVINDVNSNDCIVLDYLIIQVGKVNKCYFSGKLQVDGEVSNFAGDLRKGVTVSGGSRFVEPIIHKPIVIIKAKSDLANDFVCFYYLH